MKRKLFFASVAIATVLASCTKEEIVNVDNQLQELGDRPMVEAPVVTLGNAGTKMTTSGVYAGVKWEAGDGFGAAVMDIYNGENKDFAKKFTIVDYINSNVLFSTEDGTSFHAEASMPEGNHLFYAPFNKKNISRKALATQLPLEQVVANPSSNAAAPSNDIITAFYEDGTSPVFVAYEKINGEAKTSLDLQMRHIYSLPLVTLKLGKTVQLVDENGIHNQVEVVVNGKKEMKDIYESEIVVDSIVFVNKIASKGAISNKKVAAKLGKDKKGNIVWDADKYETAATADLLMDDTKAEKVVVKFEGGQKLTADNNGYFFMVLPGATYEANDLAVKVYTTIDGVKYESAVVTKDDKAIAPAKEVRLLPGLPYSADEYNQDGSMKNSKGTSMTYVVDGHFTSNAEIAAITGYNAIEDYDDLTNFITKVAYRGEELVEVSKAWAETELAKKTGSEYDPRKHFVVTAKAEAPVVLDDAFVAEFERSCVITGKTASIKFLGNCENVVLGDITWDDNASEMVKFEGSNKLYAKGNVVFDLEEESSPSNIYALDGAVVDLDGEVAVTVMNLNDATVNVKSEAAHYVVSLAGTVNILASTDATVYNGVNVIVDEEDEDEITITTSTLNIADGVKVDGTITNEAKTSEGVSYKAVVNVNNAIATIVNNGDITVNSNKAKLTVTGNGNVNNTIGGVVTNNDNNVVYANVTTFKDLNKTYDALCGLNMLNMTGCVEHNLTLSNIKTINFNAGSSLSMGSATWDWSSVENININANVNWTGRHTSASIIKVKTGAIKVADKKKFNITDIDVVGYQAVVDNNNELADAIAAGISRVVLNEGNYTLDLYNATDRESLTIVGTGNTQISFDKQQVGIGKFGEVIIENCEIMRMATKTWGMLVFSSGKEAGIYTIRNCTFNGVGTQGIYINEANSNAVYNIENCTFNGDFGTEGAITIQCNTGAKSTVNVKECTFKNIPSTSHKVCLVPGSDKVISNDISVR